MVTAEYADREDHPRVYYFAVGNTSQVEAASAVRSLPQMTLTSEIHVSRRLASSEIVAIDLHANEIRPL